jgi:hypothetical protein
MAVTDKHEHSLTQKALDTLTKWGKDPNTGGGENITFSVSRQGASSDPFLALGDCTPFTPSGKRGTLNGQPAGNTGAPVAYFDNFGGITSTLQQVPCAFSFDLNAGKVHLSGTFPNNLPSNLEFRVEYFKQFDGAGGENILFYSEQASDNAGYVIAMKLAAVSRRASQIAPLALRECAASSGRGGRGHAVQENVMASWQGHPGRLPQLASRRR